MSSQGRPTGPSMVVDAQTRGWAEIREDPAFGSTPVRYEQLYHRSRTPEKPPVGASDIRGVSRYAVDQVDVNKPLHARPGKSFDRPVV